MSTVVLAFFMLSSFLIAVPTGVKIFNWAPRCGAARSSSACRCCSRRRDHDVPDGRDHGIFLAVFPVDWQLTDTYFVVAHFHYTAFGGSAFAIFAAAYFWFPKMSGRMLSETLARWSFAFVFIGFHLTFLIQHSAGLAACRGASTSTRKRGLERNNLSRRSARSFLASAAAARHQHVALAQDGPSPAGPVEGNTLEWFTPSPPPENNFDVDPAGALGRADEGHPAPDRAADRRRSDSSARQPMVPMSRRAPPTRVEPAASAGLADYVTLTKPKVQLLLLLTT
jgi:cytochrome c oxidase subunit 1